jgi:hypothetical protein
LHQIPPIGARQITIAENKWSFQSISRVRSLRARAGEMHIPPMPPANASQQFAVLFFDEERDNRDVGFTRARRSSGKE